MAAFFLLGIKVYFFLFYNIKMSILGSIMLYYLDHLEYQRSTLNVPILQELKVAPLQNLFWSIRAICEFCEEFYWFHVTLFNPAKWSKVSLIWASTVAGEPPFRYQFFNCFSNSPFMCIGQTRSESNRIFVVMASRSNMYELHQFGIFHRFDFTQTKQ